jgi:murein DD-endopeptidase MepM/ murein hydrolase activator NlpD
LPATGKTATDEPRPGIVLAGTPRQGALIAGRLTGARQLTLDGMPVRVASDGAFIIGFGRDSGPEAILHATLPGGGTIERRLTVAARAWPTEVVASVLKRPLPDAEFTRIRAGEVAQITAARAIDSTSDGWRQAFRWPATGRISGVFGAQRVYKGGERGDPHSGVDIAVPTGTPIVAPADGVVILAADHPFTLEGNLLMIDHGMGLNSAFLHLSRIDVKVGDVVRQGQPIGASGMTGRASGPHLHWAMKWLDRRIDPAALNFGPR